LDILTVFIAAGVAVCEKANPAQAMSATKQTAHIVILLFMAYLPFTEESSWKSLLGHLPISTVHT
jgi:hypothetical protein